MILGVTYQGWKLAGSLFAGVDQIYIQGEWFYVQSRLFCELSWTSNPESKSEEGVFECIYEMKWNMNHN